MTKVSKDCKKPGFIYIGQDDENVHQMNFLHDIFNEIKNLNAIKTDITYLKLSYNSYMNYQHSEYFNETE